MFRRVVTRALAVSLLTTTLLMMAMAVSLAVKTSAMAQQQYVSVGENPIDWAINTLSERLTKLEGQNLDARVQVLEHGMDEIRYWTRGIAMAVLGQLVYMMIGLTRSRSDDRRRLD